jgi:hypothetical protein
MALTLSWKTSNDWWASVLIDGLNESLSMQQRCQPVSKQTNDPSSLPKFRQIMEFLFVLQAPAATDGIRHLQKFATVVGDLPINAT